MAIGKKKKMKSGKDPHKDGVKPKRLKRKRTMRKPKSGKDPHA